MVKRLFSILTALLLTAGVSPTAWGALADLGIPIEPHGFPAYYEDATGLKLEPCLPPPAGNATVDGMCIYDPLDETSDLIVAGEIFWWMASASIDMPGGGSADIEFAIEGTFGGTEEPIDGQQISFGRTRIRIDTPVTGTYTITHPYGIISFDVTDTEEGINYTSDIGSANFLDPKTGFRGTLTAPIGPFLTWPDYESEELLQVLDIDGVTVLEQYVGVPGILNPVVGSTFIPDGETEPANYFRVQGPGGLDEQTFMFSVMGKVFDPSVTLVEHTFPGVPPKNLFAVGPVNRVTHFATPSTAEVTGVDIEGYPVGYPLWYQENIGTTESPVGGLKLTLCTPGDPMCISDPIDPNNEAHTTLRTGGEGFYWSADATFDTGAGDADLILGLEATFGGDEAIVDGNQITFGRVRIRVDTPVAGTYRVTHPYGVRIFENVGAGGRAINSTVDIGIADLDDPDGAFAGALYSDIGRTFLKWTTFNEDPNLTDPLLVKTDPITGETKYFVGDPGLFRPVVGSPFGTNFFRVERLTSGTVESGTWTQIGQTNQFAVSGQVFVEEAAPPDPVIFPYDIGIFRNGDWYLDTNGSGAWEAGLDTRYRFGIAGDIPVVGDWNGDGIMQIGIFRNGDWYLDTNGNGIWEAGVDTRYRFGIAGDIPVVGDWNGDGKSQIGIFRNGDWYLDTNGNGIWETGVDTRYRFGIANDLPITGDWNGDGKTQIGIFRNGDWYLDTNGNGAWETGVDTRYRFGIANDLPITGDWNGDGKTQIGIFRNGDWYLDTNGNGAWETGVDTRYRFGIAGDKPVAGTW